MAQKKNFIHPNFILGLATYFLFFIAAILISDEIFGGKLLAITTLVLAAIHWIWGLKDAWTDRDLKGREVDNFFWFVTILLIPPLAGLMYYMVNNKRIKI